MHLTYFLQQLYSILSPCMHANEKHRGEKDNDDKKEKSVISSSIQSSEENKEYFKLLCGN